MSAQFFQQFKPIQLRHFHVTQDQIRQLRQTQRQAFRPVRGFENFITLPTERDRDDLTKRHVIINDQNRFHFDNWHRVQNRLTGMAPNMTRETLSSSAPSLDSA